MHNTNNSQEDCMKPFQIYIHHNLRKSFKNLFYTYAHEHSNTANEDELVKVEYILCSYNTMD